MPDRLMKTILQLFAAIVFATAARVSAQENVAPPPPPAESPPLSPEASFFYDELAPHGQWFWLEPYGWARTTIPGTGKLRGSPGRAGPFPICL